MFVNLSNHPSSNWTPEQISAAGGNVVDLPFPQVLPDGDEAYIENLADEYLQRILEMKDVSAVHLMGEMNFTFSLVNKLKAKGVRCVASTTTRETVEENGVKVSRFNFVRYRDY